MQYYNFVENFLDVLEIIGMHRCIFNRTWTNTDQFRYNVPRNGCSFIIVYSVSNVQARTFGY